MDLFEHIRSSFQIEYAVVKYDKEKNREWEATFIVLPAGGVLRGEESST